MNKMNPVVHFEMPVEDRERAKQFYAKSFGWEFNQLGAEMGNYTVVMTAESDNQGPLKRGIINGGFFQKTKDNQYPSVVIAVDDIRAAMKKVEDAGGKVIGASKPGKQPDDIPGVGLYISIEDSEGNRVGMLQPSGEMK